MKKLISNRVAEKIKKKHTEQEIKNGIITLKRIEDKHEIWLLLQQKLLEEVNEYLSSVTAIERIEELNDIILICEELRDGIDKFSKGYVLVNTRGSIQKK